VGVLARATKRFRSCATGSGAVVVDIRVEADGRADTSLHTSTVDEAAAKCAVEVAERLRFPARGRGLDGVLSIPVIVD
jgi:hypothetical protein